MSSRPEDTSQWCEERLCQPGEDLRLARLFTAADLRPAVTASGAIYIELEAIALKFRDLNVARAKFDWWREELARLDAGKPAHPATRLLTSGTAKRVPAQLYDLVTGMELNLLAGPPGDLGEAESWAERGFANLATALASRLGAESAQGYRALGAAIGLARSLQALPADTVYPDIAAAARTRLQAERVRLPAPPPALLILAALAWRRAAQPRGQPLTKREARRRVFTAWRAARGKLPRRLRDRDIEQSPRI